MHHNVVKYGFSDRLSSFRSLEMRVNDFQENHERTESAMISQVEKAISEDQAEGIVLGCTMEYGFFEKLQSRFHLPVIDPVIAALKHCEQLAWLNKQLGWSPSRLWSCEAPTEAEIKRLKLFQSPPEFGAKDLIH